MKRADLHSCFSRGIVLMLAVLWLTCTQAHALTVQDIRVGLHPDKTRMVIELSEMSKFRVFVLADPWRLVIDLPDFEWQAGRISNPSQSPVLSVKQGAYQRGISRIVFDLKGPVAVKDAFLLRKAEGRPDRLVIDMLKSTPEGYARDKDKTFGLLDFDEAPVREKDERQAAGTPADAPVAKAAPVPPPPPREAMTLGTLPASAVAGMAVPQRKPAQRLESSAMTATPGATPAPARREKRTIVIDAGHGGVDPGAIGANGTFEKNVTLAAAKELKHALESTGRYEVSLTREGDKYLRLYQRVDIARGRKADLFISLHADSIGKSSVRGASVYTLSEKASDEQTERLAEQENKADIIAGTDLSHEDEQVATILIDLAMRDTMNQSIFFANTLVDSMEDGDIGILDSAHRHAGFAVLKAPDVPSVLIEMGFMSNKQEAQMLSSPEYRRNLAQAIAGGIDAYFSKVDQNSRI